MGRSKKPAVEIEAEEMDLEAEVDEAAEMELSDDADEIAEALAAEEAEEETEVKEEQKPARKPRARKPRTPRKKAEPAASLLESMSTTEDEEKEPEVVVAEAEEEAPAVEAKEEKEEAPKKRAPRAKSEKKTDLQTAIENFEGNPDTLREDLTVASVAIQKSMDNMAKQWGTVNEISTSVCTNLERVNTMLREAPAQDRFKTPIARPAAITKAAVAISVFSVVLSIVSLLLSQSARQAALEKAPIAVTAPAPRVETTNVTRPQALAFGQIPQKRTTKSTPVRPPLVQRTKKRSR